MCPDWVFWGLWAVVGIVGGGVVPYLLSQTQQHLALWCGFFTFVVASLAVTLHIRNDLVRREVEAATPVYFGTLTPASESTPPLPSSTPKGTVSLMLGDELRLLTAQSESYVLSKAGKPFLTVGIQDGRMQISAVVMDSRSQLVVRIINNEFQANPQNAFNPKQPDKHSLVVRDAEGAEVLNVRFLNPTAMRIVGRFQIPGVAEPVVILPDDGVRWPGGGGISRLTVDMTASKGGFLEFP